MWLEEQNRKQGLLINGITQWGVVGWREEMCNAWRGRFPGWIAAWVVMVGMVVWGGSPGHLAMAAGLGPLVNTLGVNVGVKVDLPIALPLELLADADPNAPVYTTDPITGATEDAAYVYLVEARSPLNRNVTIRALDLPAWLTLLTTGMGRAEIYGIPGQAEVGTHTALLEASDGLLLTVQSFVVVVTEVNDPPQFTTRPLLHAIKDQEYLYLIEAEDEEDGELVFGALELPPWLTLYEIGPGQAALQGVPGNFDGGAQNVVVTVSDGVFVTEQTFLIDVEPFRISSVSLNGREFQICWEAVPGRLYRIERRGMDPSAKWVRVAEIQTGTAFGCWIDNLNEAAGVGLYRVVEAPQ